MEAEVISLNGRRREYRGERPTLDGLAWLAEVLAHLVERASSAIGIAYAAPQTNGWERDGRIRIRTVTTSGMSYWHAVPIGAVNGHDTEAVLRALIGDAELVLADTPTMVRPVRVAARELAAALMTESKWLNGFDGR